MVIALAVSARASNASTATCLGTLARRVMSECFGLVVSRRMRLGLFCFRGVVFDVRSARNAKPLVRRYKADVDSSAERQSEDFLLARTKQCPQCSVRMRAAAAAATLLHTPSPPCPLDARVSDAVSKNRHRVRG